MTNPGLYADYLANARLSYVVKKHHATRLHYDLRFEYWSPLGKLELASFVIVQGPSLDPTCIRPAIRDRDHDVRYMLSERVIQPGQRGAGPVLVWDKGRYRALSGISGQPVDLETALQEGRVVIEAMLETNHIPLVPRKGKEGRFERNRRVSANITRGEPGIHR